MPLAVLKTNLSRAMILPNFKVLLLKTIADVLSKPSGRIMVVVEPDTEMVLGESDAPIAWLVVHSIGVFSAEKNPAIAEAIQKLIERELKIPKHRILVTLRDLPEADAATLHTMKL